MKSFEEYSEGIFNPLMSAPRNHRAIIKALPSYVDEVLVPEIMTRFQVPADMIGKDKRDDRSAEGWHHAIKSDDDQVHGDPVALGKAAEEIQVNDVPDPTWVDWSERLVRLKDVMLSLSGIDVDQRDGGWWETSTGVKMGQDVIDQIRAASFVPHDGAPDLQPAMKIAIEALGELSRLGNGDRMGNSVGNEVAQTALQKIMELNQGVIIPDVKERSGADQIRATQQVIENNAKEQGWQE